MANKSTCHLIHNEELILYKHYNPDEYPQYANYDAINVQTYSEIPDDYEGIMGVPITFIDKYNPNQFEIIGCCEPAIEIETYKKCSYFKEYKSRQFIHNGQLCQKTYHRLLIRRRQSKKVPYNTIEMPVSMAAEES